MYHGHHVIEYMCMHGRGEKKVQVIGHIIQAP